MSMIRAATRADPPAIARCAYCGLADRTVHMFRDEATGLHYCPPCSGEEEGPAVCPGCGDDIPPGCFCLCDIPGE